jgi:hypothetical protein
MGSDNYKRERDWKGMSPLALVIIGILVLTHLIPDNIEDDYSKVYLRSNQGGEDLSSPQDITSPSATVGR